MGTALLRCSPYYLFPPQHTPLADWLLQGYQWLHAEHSWWEAQGRLRSLQLDSRPQSRDRSIRSSVSRKGRQHFSPRALDMALTKAICIHPTAHTLQRVVYTRAALITRTTRRDGRLSSKTPSRASLRMRATSTRSSGRRCARRTRGGLTTFVTL